MVSAGARQPRLADSSSSLPMRASTGSAARWWPAGAGTRWVCEGGQAGRARGQRSAGLRTQALPSTRQLPLPHPGASALLRPSARPPPAAPAPRPPPIFRGAAAGRARDGTREGGRAGVGWVGCLAFPGTCEAGQLLQQACGAALQGPSQRGRSARCPSAGRRVTGGPPAARARGRRPPCPGAAGGSAAPAPPAAPAPSRVAAAGGRAVGGWCGVQRCGDLFGASLLHVDALNGLAHTAPRPAHLVAPHAVLKARAGVEPVADAGAHAASAPAPLLGCAGGWAGRTGGQVSTMPGLLTDCCWSAERRRKTCKSLPGWPATRRTRACQHPAC